MGGQFSETTIMIQKLQSIVSIMRGTKDLKEIIGNSSFLTNLLIVFCILFCRMPTTT